MHNYFHTFNTSFYNVVYYCTCICSLVKMYYATFMPINFYQSCISFRGGSVQTHSLTAPVFAWLIIIVTLLCWHPSQSHGCVVNYNGPQLSEPQDFFVESRLR